MVNAPGRIPIDKTQSRARAILEIVDHISSPGQSTSRLLIFTDTPSPLNSPLAGALKVKAGERDLLVKSFPLDRLSTVPTLPGDIVIVEAVDPSQDKVEELKTTLSSSWRGAKYRGIFAGSKQSIPEEIAKPIGRKNIPRAFEKAIGHSRDEVQPASPQPSRAPMMRISSR